MKATKGGDIPYSQQQTTRHISLHAYTYILFKFSRHKIPEIFHTNAVPKTHSTCVHKYWKQLLLLLMGTAPYVQCRAHLPTQPHCTPSDSGWPLTACNDSCHYQLPQECALEADTAQIIIQTYLHTYITVCSICREMQVYACTKMQVVLPCQL